MPTTKMDRIPYLPLRGMLVFPKMVLHIDVGRERSMAAIEQAIVEENKIFLVSQRDISVEQPSFEELYGVGTLAEVKQTVKLPNGTMRVLIEGLDRANLIALDDGESYSTADIEVVEPDGEADIEHEALMRTLLEQFKKYSKLSKKVTEETYESVADISDPGRLADMVAANLPLKVAGKQEVLELFDVKERIEWLISRLLNEQEVLSLEQKINKRVKEAMERRKKSFT